MEVKGGGFFLSFFKFQLLRGKEYTNSRKSSAKGFLKSPFQIRSFFFHGVDFALIIKRIECRNTYLVSSEEGKEGRRSGRIKKIIIKSKSGSKSIFKRLVTKAEDVIKTRKEAGCCI